MTLLVERASEEGLTNALTITAADHYLSESFLILIDYKKINFKMLEQVRGTIESDCNFKKLGSNFILFELYYNLLKPNLSTEDHPNLAKTLSNNYIRITERLYELARSAGGEIERTFYTLKTFQDNCKKMYDILLALREYQGVDAENALNVAIDAVKNADKNIILEVFEQAVQPWHRKNGWSDAQFMDEAGLELLLTRKDVVSLPQIKTGVKYSCNCTVPRVLKVLLDDDSSNFNMIHEANSFDIGTSDPQEDIDTTKDILKLYRALLNPNRSIEDEKTIDEILRKRIIIIPQKIVDRAFEAFSKNTIKKNKIGIIIDETTDNERIYRNFYEIMEPLGYKASQDAIDRVFRRFLSQGYEHNDAIIQIMMSKTAPAPDEPAPDEDRAKVDRAYLGPSFLVLYSPLFYDNKWTFGLQQVSKSGSLKTNREFYQEIKLTNAITRIIASYLNGPAAIHDISSATQTFIDARAFFSQPAQQAMIDAWRNDITQAIAQRMQENTAKKAIGHNPISNQMESQISLNIEEETKEYFSENSIRADYSQLSKNEKNKAYIRENVQEVKIDDRSTNMDVMNVTKALIPSVHQEETKEVIDTTVNTTANTTIGTTVEEISATADGFTNAGQKKIGSEEWFNQMD